MKKSGLLVTMLALTLMFGCKKKDSDPAPATNFSQVSTLNKNTGNLSVDKYEYNSLNQIYSITNEDNKTIFTYNNDGKLNTVQRSSGGENGELNTLSYGANNLVSKVVKSNGGNIFQTITYEYNGNALVRAISGYDTTTYSSSVPVLKVSSYNGYYYARSNAYYSKDSTYLTLDADNNVVKEERMFNYNNTFNKRVNGKYTSKVVAYSSVVAGGSTPKRYYSVNENPNGLDKQGNILNETTYVYVNNKDAGKAVVSSTMNSLNYNVVNNVIKSMDVISIDYDTNPAELTSYETKLSNYSYYFDYK